MSRHATTTVFLLLLALLLGLAACQPLPRRPPEIIGTLRIQGPNVTLNGALATDGMAFTNGDVVVTGPASRARLVPTTGGFIQFEENTDPIIKAIWKGLCWIIIKIEGGMFGAQTGSCGQITQDPYGNEIFATSQYVLAVGGQASVFTLLDGSAEVRAGRRVRVQPGEQVVATRDFISDPRRISGREVQLLIAWLESFDFTGARPAIMPVAVPPVVGLSTDRARQTLDRAGLALGQVTERPSSEASPGTILDQKPNAGTRVPPGTAIYVEVAVSPPPPVRVPNLRGLTLPEAERRLAQARLRLGEPTARASEARPDTIIAQTPPAGSIAPPDSLVEVVVAQVRQAEVPALFGLTLDEAEQRLSRVALRLGDVEERETGDARPGTIIAQRPGPGAQLPPGAQVNVTVATGLRLQQVPQLFGSSLAEADRRLHAAGLRRGRVSEQLSESRAQGTVVGQRPEPGATVPPGSAVDVTLAVAARRVPNLVGETLRGVRSRLSRTELSLGRVSEEATRTFEPDTVMRQSPPPGALVAVGTGVDVTIAKPLPVFQPSPPFRPLPPPQPERRCTAPKIDGLSYERAKQLLAERGLQGRVRRTYGEDSNTVYRQEPPPGAQFPCDQPIAFDLGTIG
jgi:beta-lactam-binding protein with PASTA domain